ncbi:MAG: hypothetical protein M2R45_01089 [Verrucomicrobia subdivision 3 bacterium]|nr:hypothetical protein [Limisphaerales bacterium]MCS1414200.1 hypothetical protein [Limisphaerales bacterium]
MKTNPYLYAGLAGVVLIALLLVFGSRPAIEETAPPPVAKAKPETPDSDASRWMRAQRKRQEAKQEAEETAYWESRQEWIANFPFKPTPHPTITYDPEVYDVHHRKKQERTPANREMWRLLERHSFLSYFYHDCEKERYSPEFEKMHAILSASGLEEDPYIWGRLFTHLIWYHRVDGQPYPVPQANQPWGEEKEGILESFIGCLRTRKGLDGKTKYVISIEEAIAIRERLLNEIPAEDVLKHHIIVGHSKYEEMLQPGDPLLVR